VTLRSRSRTRAAVLVLAGAVLAGAGLPAVLADPAGAAPPRTAAQARAQADALRASVAELGTNVAAATAAYEAARDAHAEAALATSRARRQLEVATAEQVEDTEALRRRVRAVYSGGGGVAVMAQLLEGSGPADMMRRAEVVQQVVAADREAVREGRAALLAAERARTEVRDSAQETTRLAAAAAAAADRVDGLLTEQRLLLERADADVRRLVEAEARAEAQRRAEELARVEAERLAQEQARAAASAAGPAPAGRVPGGPAALPGIPSGGGSSDRSRVYAPPGGGRMACPVGATNSFVDTWLAPRSGGRKHQGTDVFAPQGSPAYAIVDGVIDKVGNGGLGGITLWIRADDGDRFYYAHNDANLVRVGDRVTAGQPIARVGKTGNARTTPPHVHFEAHPRGGAAANPYPLLKALCG
jgi:peptidoglycan LD-endopeptidase LytH